jgi:TonB family protein
MASYVNTWRKPEQFELYVKKFRSLFDMHHVEFGLPENFPGFMTKLVQDRHFAMDFWALTGTLSKREGGELSVEQVLAVIVDGVIGEEIPAGDDGLKTLIDELATLLAGVDLYSPSRLSDEEDIETFAPPASPPSYAVPKTRFADMTERAAGEVRPTSFVAPPPSSPPSSVAPPPSSAAAPVSSASAPTFIANESVSAHSTSPIAIAQHQLDEALMRLEMNSIELKEHLDDLDKKMSRIEPHLEALTSKVNFTERPRVPAEEPIDRSFERAVRKPAENPRLVLDPVADKHDEPPISTPLAGYSQRSGHRSLVLFVAIFALLIIGGIVFQQRYGSSLWQSYGVTLREKYDAVLQKMHGADRGQVAANSASQNVTPNTVAESSPAVITANDAGSVSSPAIPSAPTPSPAESSNAPSPTMAGHEAVPASVEPHDVDTRSNPRSSRKTHSAYSETVEKAAVDQASSGDDEIGTVTVAPSVMKANLVASRVPAYPEAAKANHIEGPVVVQAIISKAGVVDRVHVIEGNPQLRSAAAEAVQKWRYRPYLLNGQPVEVATTVTVDFKLDR